MKTPFILSCIIACSPVSGVALDGYPSPFIKSTYRSVSAPATASEQRGSKSEADAENKRIKTAIADANKSRKKPLKISKKPFKYEMYAVGTDENGYVCGRIVITDYTTGKEVGVYDYRSLIDSDRIKNKPFEIIVRKRGELKDEKWTISTLMTAYGYDSRFLLISIPSLNFTDLIIGPDLHSMYPEGRNSNEKISYEKIIEIRGEGSGHHPFISSAPKKDALEITKNDSWIYFTK